ncbi:MAG: Chromosome partitioning protein ParA [Phycisphaerae bacterium]|nr:Chromosome partitioning protein ParA [Phycisphaerae bacterium]
MRERIRGAVIAVGNQKGGVGKTTNTVHLAAALGQGGYRCLIIDLDPAAGATRHLGVPENQYAGTLELLTEREAIDQLLITEGLPHGVHLIAARPQLSELDAALSKFTDRSRLLDAPLRAIRRSYNFILLDTPPFAGATTTVAAYSVAEWILLSAFPHPLSLGGLSEAFRDISDVRTHRNAALEVLGIVFSNVDGRATRLRAELEAAAAIALPGRQFATHISQAVLIPELSGRGRTLFQLDSYLRNPVAHQYLRLAAEIEHRIRHRSLFLSGNLPELAEGTLCVPRALEQPAEPAMQTVTGD